MALKTPAWFGQLKGSAKEADKRFAQDKRERAAAERLPRPKILTKADIQTGQWNPAKILQTTLDGKKRDITVDDLRAFQANMRTFQAKVAVKDPRGDSWLNGVTAKQVIDLSLQVDRDRASKNTTVGGQDLEAIRYAVPTSAGNGTVRFITNAGGSTPGVTRHHVVVKFLNYHALANAATVDATGGPDAKANAKKDALASAKLLLKGPLMFDCDCGRHRYWYRYIATIGGFNAGRPELGFPKIRNPHLRGIACKHVIRVMSEISAGGTVTAFMARLMEKAKLDAESKAQVRATDKESARLLSRMQRRTTGHEVKVTAQRNARRALNRAVAVEKLAPNSKTAPMPGHNDPHAALREAMRKAHVPEAQIEQTILNLTNANG